MMIRNSKRFFALFLPALFAFGGMAFSQGLPFEQEPAPDSSPKVAQQIINAKNKPVFIDFWAPWCMPCRILTPTVQKLEEDYKGRAIFLRVNVDNHHQIASYFRVSGIPAVFIIRNRSVKQSIVGLQPDSVYRAALDEVLALPPEKDSSAAKPKAPKKS